MPNSVRLFMSAPPLKLLSARPQAGEVRQRTSGFAVRC
jgi:hypothetical protein